jgi:hypothetical protein
MEEKVIETREKDINARKRVKFKGMVEIKEERERNSIISIGYKYKPKFKEKGKSQLLTSLIALTCNPRENLSNSINKEAEYAVESDQKALMANALFSFTNDLHFKSNPPIPDNEPGKVKRVHQESKLVGYSDI